MCIFLTSLLLPSLPCLSKWQLHSASDLGPYLWSPSQVLFPCELRLWSPSESARFSPPSPRSSRWEPLPFLRGGGGCCNGRQSGFISSTLLALCPLPLQLLSHPRQSAHFKALALPSSCHSGLLWRTRSLPHPPCPLEKAEGVPPPIPSSITASEPQVGLSREHAALPHAPLLVQGWARVLKC